MPAVEGDALLIGIGTFGIGTAGFSAVAASLRTESKRWSPAHSLRVRAIVSTSLNVAFESVIPVIAVLATGNMHSGLVIASLITGVYGLTIVGLRTPQWIRAGGMRNRSMLIALPMGYISVALYFLNAIVFASVAVYAMGLSLQLLVAAISFYGLIAETT